jgi:membrane protein
MGEPGGVATRLADVAQGLFERLAGLPVVRALAPVARPFVRAASAYAHRDDGLRAGGIAFFAMLSFFPLVLLMAAVAAFLAEESPDEAQQVVWELRRFAPFLREAFWEDLHALAGRRGLFSAASLLALFFLSSRVTVALEQAMRRIFAAPPRRRGVRRFGARLRAYAMTLFVLLAIGGLFVGSNVYRYLDSIGLVRQVELLALVQRLPYAPRLFAMLVVGTVAYQLYLRVPPVPVRARHALAGALLFTLGHEAAVVLYTRLYTARLATYTALYGSFVGLVALALWVYWLSALALYGGELVAVLGGQLAPAGGPEAQRDAEARG